MKKAEKAVRFLTQNLRCGNIRDPRDGDENRIRVRQFRFKKLIEKYDPDVICMQECTTGWLGLLEDGILDEYTIVNKWRERGIDQIRFADLESCPVAYKTAKFDELERGYFWLSETPDRCSPSYVEGDSPRICSWVHLRDKASGAEFYAYSTHFGLGEGRAAIESGKQFARLFQSLPQGANAVMMGDLNCTYRSACYDQWAYTDGLTDLRDIAEAMAKDGLCTIGELRKGTYNQFKCPDGSHYIDHVIAKPNSSMAVDYFSVIYDFFADAEHQVPLGYVSDHFAVVCDLRFDTEQDFSNYYQNRRASDE